MAFSGLYNLYYAPELHLFRREQGKLELMVQELRIKTVLDSDVMRSIKMFILT